MWLESVSQSENHQEKCPTCGSGVQRRMYGEVYGGAFIQDGKRVDIRATPPDGFSDPIVLDPLTQYFAGRLYRLWPNERYVSCGGKRLHLHVWEAVFGPRPAHCHIHHCDGNTLYNALSNLECLPQDEHLRLDMEERYRNGTAHSFGSLARTNAAAWHASEEGREWHRRNAQRSQSWTKWTREERPCASCGTTFLCLVRANGREQKYCSERCKATYYRRRNKAQR